MFSLSPGNVLYSVSFAKRLIIYANLRSMVFIMLTVSHIGFGYQNVSLFKEVSFSLSSGELLHLKGSNGSGKSTLIKLIAGLLKPTAGAIKFGSKTSAEWPQINFEYLPADRNGLYLRRNAYENLWFFSKLRGLELDESKITDVAKKWGLSRVIIHSQFPVAKFSTGTKRRLALARVELSNAPIWLLDEPTSGLDIAAMNILKQTLIKKLSEKKGAVVLISHELGPLSECVTKEINIEDFRAV